MKAQFDFTNDEDGTLRPTLTWVSENAERKQFVPEAREIASVVTPQLKQAFKHDVDVIIEKVYPKPHRCTVCQGDARFHTDQGDRCEVHLLQAGDWAEAWRLS